MNINSISSAATAPETPVTGAAKKGEDRETFLQLLVAQLKNQDPLAPQDATQFVAQLAQFSSLDQLISINQQLGELLAKGDQPDTK
jgi:flagellar basal-body rod modification protein FlgD